MPRVPRGFKARRRRNKWLKQAKGFRAGRRRYYRLAKENVVRALDYAYRDRRARKRDFRRLWITRINAAARMNSLNYSRLMSGLSKANVELDWFERWVRGRKYDWERSPEHPPVEPAVEASSDGGR